MEHIILEESELAGFINDLEQVEKVRQGDISLSAENPNEFSLRLKSIDKLGHFEAVLKLGRGEEYQNKLTVSFEIDPSSLPVLLLHLQDCELSYKHDNKIKTIQYKQQAGVINKLLEEWDFIGVISNQHKGEYTDLINPILNILSDNANEDTLADFVSKEITNSYGIKMKSEDEDVRMFSKRVIEWWNS